MEEIFRLSAWEMKRIVEKRISVVKIFDNALIDPRIIYVRYEGYRHGAMPSEFPNPLK